MPSARLQPLEAAARPPNITPLEDITRGAKPPAPATSFSDNYGNMQVDDMILGHITEGIGTGGTYGMETRRVLRGWLHRPITARRKLPIDEATKEDFHAEDAAVHLMPITAATMSAGTMRTAHADRDLATEGVGMRVAYGMKARRAR